MSRKLLMVAFAVLSIASASGAVANEIRSDNAPIVREDRSAPIVRNFGLSEDATQSGARSVEGTDSHVVKAGLWGSIKSAAKKVGSGVKTAAKAVATGAKRAATGVASGVKKVAVPVGKAIWNNGPVKGVRDAYKALKELKKKIS